jgi:hypothetical protein
MYCCRMAAFPDGAMTMQMMGPDKSEVPAGNPTSDAVMSASFSGEPIVAS